MASKPTPGTHQPTKAEMDEVIAIDATPDEIASAVLQGGAPRQESDNDAALESWRRKAMRGLLKALRVEVPEDMSENLPEADEGVRR